MSLTLNLLTGITNLLPVKNSRTVQPYFVLKNENSYDTFERSIPSKEVLSFGGMGKKAELLSEACKIAENNLKIIKKKLKHAKLTKETKKFLESLQKYYEDMIKLAWEIDPKTLVVMRNAGQFKNNWLRFVKLHKNLKNAHETDYKLLPKGIEIQSPDILADFVP